MISCLDHSSQIRVGELFASKPEKLRGVANIREAFWLNAGAGAPLRAPPERRYREGKEGKGRRTRDIVSQETKSAE